MSVRASSHGVTAVLTAGSLLLCYACEKSAPPAAGRNDVVEAEVVQGAAPPSVRHDERVFAGGIAPAATTFAKPSAGGTRAVAEGEKLFNSMNCDGCHGGGATGWVGPSLIAGRWRYGGADTEVFESIYYGRSRGMPAFGGVLQPEMIRKIVTYLKAQPPPKSMPTQSW